METVGVIGAGLIGRGWAIVFARGGFDVALWDHSKTAIDETMLVVRDRLEQMSKVGLIADPEAALSRIRPVSTMSEAVANSIYVQENLPESIEVKRSVFADLDRLTPGGVVIASSTSAIAASSFTEHLSHRERCLIAHPANPPYLIPAVELCPAPRTADESIQQAAELLLRADMVPVVVRKELHGFLLNRLQGALISEAFRLVEEGYALPDDIDKLVRHGLGLRWSFMGPFETIDLNAPGGIADYCQRYGMIYTELRAEPPPPKPWSPQLVSALSDDRRARLPTEQHAARQAWRDRRLMHLMAHKAAMDGLDQL